MVNNNKNKYNFDDISKFEILETDIRNRWVVNGKRLKRFEMWAF